MKLLFLSLAALQSASPYQFDLICAGIVQRVSSTPYDPVPIVTRYRVDLDRRLYCREPCTIQWEIAAVHPTVLHLMWDHNHEGGGWLGRITINRQTGEYSLIEVTEPQGEADGLREDGVCERTSFSGLPALQVRF